MTNPLNPSVPTSSGVSGVLDATSGVARTPDAPSTGAYRTSEDFQFQGGERGATEHVTRMTGRLNASKVPDSEVKALYDERLQLVDKQLNGSISNKELIRLEYVRWSLDRIEDAKHGAALDTLEGHIASFERFANQLKNLQNGLNKAATSKRR